MPPPIKILIADDHSIMRSGLRNMLTTQADVDVVGEAADGDGVLDAIACHAADVLLLDLSMPGLSGIDLIRRVRALQPLLPILILSMHVEGQIVTRALRAGAAGYVTKDADPEDLITAIRKVANKGRYIDPALVDSVIVSPVNTEQHDQPHEALSPRELQVLERIAAGMPLGTIADELHLSPKTVSTHKMRLMQKLGLESNADLLKYAIRHGLTGH